jgi:hypothetical protein
MNQNKTNNNENTYENDNYQKPFKEPTFMNTKNQIEEDNQLDLHISPQKKMQVPSFDNPDSFRNISKNNENSNEKVIKVSHIDQFFKNKQSINRDFYKAPSTENSNKQITQYNYGNQNNNEIHENNNMGGMWEDQGQGDFTEEDFKKLEKKALPKDYMGGDIDDDDALKFY